MTYRGENLAGYAGESVVLRYEPRDITTILVYRQQGSQEEFLARAYAQDLESEELSLDEAKAMSRRIRQAGKTVSNRSILAEVQDRETVARWEKFRFNPPPSRQQLEALAKVVGVDADRLEQMLPPAGVGMNLEPIRLCAACYLESPCHQIQWQFKVTQGCQHHHLSLLSECPSCGARFKVPALWVDGWCHRCFLPFGEMVESQNFLESHNGI